MYRESFSPSLERGFIRAGVYHYDDLLSCGSEAKVKEKGLFRLESKIQGQVEDSGSGMNIDLLTNGVPLKIEEDSVT